MRYLIGLALALFLSASVAKTPDRNPVVRFTPIALDRDNPGQRTYGALTLLGAWKLTSNNPLFGGISSMRVEGDRFLVLSDWAQTFRFSFDGQEKQVRLRVRALPGIFRPNHPEPDRDSESMTTDHKTGRMWVGFEASNSIRAFSRNLGQKKAWVAPPAMAGWPENAGPEAMVRLSDGRFIVLGEEVPGPEESSEALLFPGDPIGTANAAMRFYYKPPARFDPTDAAELPDGRILILNRHFSVFDGVSAAMTIIDPREIAQDKVVKPLLVAKFGPPFNIDNMEALSVDVQRGKIIVWIASDDNFNPLQQSVLFKFALDLDRAK
jgi:hypothetical protein